MQNLSNRLVRRRLFGAWVSTVISISLVLLLVGVASILLLNARSVSDYFKENLQVSVLMKQDVTEEQALAYQSSLSGMPGVKATTFISREQGVEEMAQMLGRDFLDVFSTAPVPVSIDVNLEAAYVSPDSLEVVKTALSASPLVDEVVYQTSLVEALNANLQKIGLVLGVLILLLLFISFVLIGNMVRLNVFSRRFTIHTMQLVGATRGFIRAPFIGQSALQGLFAALVAILLLVGGLFILRKEFVQLFEIFRLDTLLATMGIVIVSGVLICVVSTWIVVGRLVRFDRDQLYAV
ncbi:MAG: permease-like cell division protein FtsX [Bacteroidales bacterium]|jgi:cell division transport system permease protein|nr:permease-like cell division protein FtsX [Bacteroidales bacterium]